MGWIISFTRRIQRLCCCKRDFNKDEIIIDTVFDPKVLKWVEFFWQKFQVHFYFEDQKFKVIENFIQ